jgi:hypothetical protein
MRDEATCIVAFPKQQQREQLEPALEQFAALRKIRSVNASTNCISCDRLRCVHKYNDHRVACLKNSQHNRTPYMLPSP